MIEIYFRLLKAVSLMILVLALGLGIIVFPLLLVELFNQPEWLRWGMILTFPAGTTALLIGMFWAGDNFYEKM